MSETGKVSDQQGALPNNEYVVDGAKLRCDSSEVDLKNLEGSEIVFRADPSRRFEIGDGIAATDIDTNLSNIAGNFGWCKNTDSACVPDFLPKWFNACESDVYREKKFTLKVSEIKIMVKDYREKGREVERTTEAINQELFDLQRKMGYQRTRYPAFGKPIFILHGKLKYAEDDLKTLEQLQEYTQDAFYKKLKSYSEWVKAITEAKDVLTSILGSVQGYSNGDNKDSELQKLLTMSSILVCRKLGAVNFVTNGQGTLSPVELACPDWIYFYDEEGVEQQKYGIGSGYGGLDYKGEYKHQGVDACILYDENYAPLKQVKVRAVCNGVIIAFGVNHSSMGNWIAIRSTDEYEVTVEGKKEKHQLTTRYLHMQYPLLEPAGFWTEEMIKTHANNIRWEKEGCNFEISKGTPLGYVGSLGAKIGSQAVPHLHFDINIKGVHWGEPIVFDKNTVDPHEMFPGIKIPCDKE